MTALDVTALDADLGIAPLPEGGRVDFSRLREERRRRVFSAMDEAGVDALVLGRPSNITYASGARQLWTAGARPFGPACIVVRETDRIHLLSTWDEGVPEQIGHEDLFGLSWNPGIIASNLKAIPGLSNARLVATDGYSPGAADLIAAVTQATTVVDANPLLDAARLPRTPDEITCVSVAASIAERAMTAMVDAVRPGMTERELLGVYLAAIARAGSQIPPSEGVVCSLPRSAAARLRRIVSDRPIGPGEVVVLNPGGFYAGYTASLARTWPVGGGTTSRAQEEATGRAGAALSALVSACRPGARGNDLVTAWDATGELEPPEPLAFGVGLGVEGPLIGHRAGRDVVLLAGQILTVQAWVASEGSGGALEQDTILIGPDGPTAITRFARAGTRYGRAGPVA